MLEQNGSLDQNLSTAGAALVVGGGLAGMQASLLLAATGVHVYLVDRAAAIGGHQPLLDKTFPTDSCGLCFMSPRPAAYCPFVECERSDRISVLASTELVELSGEAGNFAARLLARARGVDPALCSGCGRCAEVCPVSTLSELGGGIEKRKAIYRPFAQAVPDSYTIDWAACTRCGECSKACPEGAVDLDQQDSEKSVQVGAVILAPGFEPFDATLKTEYGYGIYPNVVTSIQIERMLSQGGPTQGTVRRPSDGLPAERIAFVQCVGSRDPSKGKHYCSSICCMYAAKQLTLLRERHAGASVVVFQMDLRAAGKGYDDYMERVQAQPGVEYRRSAVGAIKQVPACKDLLVRYVDPDGKQKEEQFSLVVLSVGVEPSRGVHQLAERLGLPLNRHGFLESGALFHEETPVRGIFVAGGGREPMDVADAVAEGAAAAASAARLLKVGLPTGDAAPTLLATVPTSLAGQAAAAKVGVLLCECGGEIGRSIDLHGLAARARSWPGVGYASVVDGLCRSGEVELFDDAIQKNGANRLVVAACARRNIEDRMVSAALQSGLNPGLLELANLREECSWVHAEAGPSMAVKAESLLSMAVARASLLEPSEEKQTELSATAMIIGGGAAGLVAATTLADAGVEVWLAERERDLGGGLRDGRSNGGASAEEKLLEGLARRVESNDRIHVLCETAVTSVEGHLGAFRTTVGSGDRVERIEHSVVVLATGTRETEPGGYLLGEHQEVMTQRELVRRLDKDPLWASKHASVAMVLCAGSMEGGNGYCSRTCCSEAVVNAIRLKAMNPEARVYLLHREMRTFGFQEEQYEEARRAGIVFLRYDGMDLPRVTAKGQALEIVVQEPLMGRPVELSVDALVLAVGVTPVPVDGLAKSLGILVDANGFLVEANVKTRSSETPRPGVFLCGTCQSPRSLAGTVVHAKAAAMRALALLSPGRVVTPITLPQINERICSGCGLCVESCAYGARVLDQEKNVSKLIAVMCQGCGACAAVCPNGATQQSGFTGRQIIAVLDAALD